MKFCVFGAGAIGGYLAVELALARHEVCVIARGAHLQAIREHGLKLRIRGTEEVVRVAASDRPADFGAQDYILCTLKTHQAYAAAGSFASLLGPDTAVVTAMNGIPWWYFYRHGGSLEGRHLQSVDPGGRQWQQIGPERAIGAVVDPACTLVAPGVVAHEQFNRFTLGEPDGSRSARVLALSEALQGAQLDAPVRDELRWNIWLKLWGNVCFNPISALTGATLDHMTRDPGLRSLCLTMMREASAVNEALGIHIPVAMMQRRLDAAGQVRGHRMSMLQDLQRGRSLEIDAIVTVVHELGQLTGVATPAIDAVLALIQDRARAAGLYRPLHEIE